MLGSDEETGDDEEEEAEKRKTMGTGEDFILDLLYFPMDTPSSPSKSPKASACYPNHFRRDANIIIGVLGRHGPEAASWICGRCDSRPLNQEETTHFKCRAMSQEKELRARPPFPLITCPILAEAA